MKLAELFLDQHDPVDKITMDIPLFLRMLEYAREDVENDETLHVVTQKAAELTKANKLLTMEDYNAIIGQKALAEDAVDDAHKQKRELAKSKLDSLRDPADKNFVKGYLRIEDPVQANLYWRKYNLKRILGNIPL